ncbi:transcription regulator padr n-terminal [Lucifera butyrica]|uniref:Transcription regulator padr n-terminal n=1 Tax=Lucifera butyrica TaxID=1351585 RepID=A0A498R2W6_9FIRM|nr:PadR family transcriptional regulator [Lucifera butyrica]VBB06976.1 transcription regulator padr n-terminal [Lucifera butyrica]
MSLSHAILGLLQYQPMSGYDIKQFIDKSVNYFWSAKQSQIYRELAGLEKRRWVVSALEKQSGRPAKRMYSPTGAGRTEFLRWLHEFPAALVEPVRDEFLVHLFFGNGLPVEETLFHLERYKKEAQARLDYFTALAAKLKNGEAGGDCAGERVYWLLTLAKGIKMAEASVQWADESMAVLNAIKREPPKKGVKG